MRICCFSCWGRNSSWIINFLTTRAYIHACVHMYMCTSRAIKMRWSTYLTKKCIVTRGLKSSISSSVVEENNDTLQWRKGYKFTRSVALNTGSVKSQWNLSNLDTLGTEESVWGVLISGVVMCMSQFSRLGTWVSYLFCVGLFVLYGCGLLGLGFLPFFSSSTTTLPM